MKKNFVISFIILILSFQTLFSADIDELEDLFYIIPHKSNNWTYGNGKDKRIIFYNTEWKIKQGNDGRLVAYPFDWSTKEGKDGRVVAYPSVLWSTKEGDDGRVVAYPSVLWSTKEGKDGRIVAYPSVLWSTKEGDDGRVIAYPDDISWQVEKGKDGRIIIFPQIYNRFIKVIFTTADNLILFKAYLNEFENKSDMQDYILYYLINIYPDL